MDFIPTRTLALPLSEVMDLELHLMATHSDVQLEAFIAGLIQRWLTIDKERLELSRNGRPLRGYQWKSVFLPEGTCLRTSYQQMNEFAKVTGDQIRMDEGLSLSPSQFANRYAKGRNAWRLIWIRFPGEEQWVRADHCRACIVEQSKN